MPAPNPRLYQHAHLNPGNSVSRNHSCHLPAAPTWGTHALRPRLEGGDLEEGEEMSCRPSLHAVDMIKLVCISRLCNVSQTFAYAGRDDVARTVHGEGGR